MSKVSEILRIVFAKSHIERVQFSSNRKRRKSQETTFCTCIRSIMANRSEVWGRELTQIQEGHGFDSL